jgi:hypothetical protein
MTETQTEQLPGHDAVPGGRIDRARRAAAQAQPEALDVAAIQAQLAGQQPAIQPVPVSASDALPVINAAAAHGNYFTVILPISTTLAPGVRQLLPRDNDRVRAFIIPVDNAIIAATTLEQAQDPTNVGGTFPSGNYMPAGGYEVTHCEPVWACNTSTSATCRVAVMVETGGPA